MNIHVFEFDRLGLRVFYMPTGSASSRPVRPQDPFLSNCAHKHTYYELHIVEAGALQIQSQCGQHQCHAGQFYLVCPGVMHAPQKGAEQLCRRFCLHFTLLPTATPFSEYLQKHALNAGFLTGDASGLLPILAQLRGHDCSHGLFSEELIHSLLSQLFVQLARSVDPQPLPATAGSTDLAQLRAVQIDHFFNNRFYCAEGEAVLAAELGVSRRQLNRIIQSLYGKSFREKLLELRLEAACELLDSALSVQEISERLGYSSCSSFTAFFKGIMGITPTEYRKSCNNL